MALMFDDFWHKPVPNTLRQLVESCRCSCSLPVASIPVIEKQALNRLGSSICECDLYSEED